MMDSSEENYMWRGIKDNYEGKGQYKMYEEKNEFSILLKKLMVKSQIKNAVLAQALQYDVSYISKWLSGRMLPAENNIEKIAEDISVCIVTFSDEIRKNELSEEYHEVKNNDLIIAIRNSLLNAYDNSKNIKKDTDRQPYKIIDYKARMPLSEMVTIMSKFISPNIKSFCNIVASIDLLSMQHESRLLLAGIKNGRFAICSEHPEIHYHLCINLEIGKRDYVYDSIFIIHMLTSFSHIDFKLYGSINSYGKIILSNDNQFSVSGMLLDNQQCIAASFSKEPSICHILYQEIQTFCCQENLLFKNTSISDMLKNHDYIQSLLSTKIKWLIGHLTEQFLPDILIEDLISNSEIHENSTRTNILKTHSLTKSVLESSQVFIMIYESAFANFVVSGELDFFNNKVFLTTDQKLVYMKNILKLLKHNNINIKLIAKGFSQDFQYITNPCLFLADTISYLRLENGCYKNNILRVNNIHIKNMFENFYEQIWNNPNEVVISQNELVMEKLQHYEQQIQMLAEIE